MVIETIKEKLDILRSLEKKEIQLKYIKQYIINEENPDLKSKFIDDCEKVRVSNESLFEYFRTTLVQPYFLRILTQRHMKEVPFVHVSHCQKFVIPEQTEIKNDKIRRNSELLVFWFLRKCIEGEHRFDINQIGKEFIIDSKVQWNNQSGESFKPFDFLIEWDNVEYKIELKTTKGDKNKFFFVSVKELEEMLKDPEHYFFLRFSFINKYSYSGTLIYTEYNGYFYMMNPDTIRLVNQKLSYYKEFYKSKKIKFHRDQFEIVSEIFDIIDIPELSQLPNIYDSKYWDKFDDFVQEIYFNDLNRILDLSYEIPEVSKLWTEFLELKLDSKFQS